MKILERKGLWSYLALQISVIIIAIIDPKGFWFNLVLQSLPLIINPKRLRSYVVLQIVAFTIAIIEPTGFLSYVILQILLIIISSKGLWSYLVLQIGLLVAGSFIAVPVFWGSAHSFQKILDYWHGLVLKVYLFVNPSATPTFSEANRVLLIVGVVLIVLLGWLTYVLPLVNSWLHKRDIFSSGRDKRIEN